MQTYANFFEENKDKINQLLAQQDQQLVAWDQALQSGSSIPETAFNTLQKEKYEESFSALMPEFRAYVKERHPKIEQDFIQTD
jgi:succinate dehydrogenase flavin-adding protein (antitoxin of CptAB toxin-antitoxin module)